MQLGNRIFLFLKLGHPSWFQLGRDKEIERESMENGENGFPSWAQAWTQLVETLILLGSKTKKNSP